MYGIHTWIGEILIGGQKYFAYGYLCLLERVTAKYTSVGLLYSIACGIRTEYKQSQMSS